MFDPSTLAAREEKLAFWIHLYNLLTLHAVVESKVKNSVIKGWMGIIRFFRQYAYQIQDMIFSLEDFEHGILRANHGLPFLPGQQFQQDDPRSAFVLDSLDPRIHFALNCASRSCPLIAYYQSGQIDDQLDLSASSFITSETEVDHKRNNLYVSSLFRLYAKDFGGRRAVIRFIMRYLDPEDPRRLYLTDHQESVKLKFTAYDWSLNSIALALSADFQKCVKYSLY